MVGWLVELIDWNARNGFDELQRLIREHVPVCYMYFAHEPAKNSLAAT